MSDLPDILAFNICMNDYGMYQLARGSGRRAHWPYAIELPNESIATRVRDPIEKTCLQHIPCWNSDRLRAYKSSLGMLPPLSASFCNTALCSQTFICAKSPIF